MKKVLLGGLLLACLATAAPAQPRCYLAVDDEPAPVASPSPSPSPTPALGTPTGGRLNVQEEGFSLGSRTPDPTALESYIRQDVVLFDSNRISTVSVTAGYLAKLNEQDQILLELEGDQSTGIFDFSYSHLMEGGQSRLTLQATGSSARTPAFDGGRFSDALEPFVRRVGGGIEFATAAGDDLTLAIALNHMQTSVADSLLGGRITPYDSQGNPITLSPSGRDSVTALRLVGLYMGLDDINFPTEGSKMRFEIQGGVTTDPFARFAANWARLVPLSDEDTFLVNLQTGTMMGTFLPYQAFNLGGANSVRGYSTGELGTARSFFQSTVEMRHMLTHFGVFGYDVGLRGVLFADYGTDLGTSASVPGAPGLVRGKTGSGFGYGAGLHFLSDFGLFRLEAGWNGQGQNSVYFTVGERF